MAPGIGLKLEAHLGPHIWILSACIGSEFQDYKALRLRVTLGLQSIKLDAAWNQIIIAQPAVTKEGALSSINGIANRKLFFINSS
jgi:hypothetical protein